MALLSIGDMATIGSAARQRTVGAYVRDGEGKLYQLTGADLATSRKAELQQARASGTALIERIVVAPADPASSVDSVELQISDLCPVHGTLGESVQRHRKGLGLVQGVVTAHRGAVRLNYAQGAVIALDLLEVYFDPTAFNSTKVAEIAPEELGSLITTWDRKAVGLLVGGRGRTGFVAPLEPYLSSHGLTLEPVDRHAPEVAHPEIAREIAFVPEGLKAMLGDLARESRLEFGEAPELV